MIGINSIGSKGGAPKRNKYEYRVVRCELGNYYLFTFRMEVPIPLGFTLVDRDSEGTCFYNDGGWLHLRYIKKFPLLSMSQRSTDGVPTVLDRASNRE